MTRVILFWRGSSWDCHVVATSTRHAVRLDYVPPFFGYQGSNQTWIPEPLRGIQIKDCNFLIDSDRDDSNLASPINLSVGSPPFKSKPLKFTIPTYSLFFFIFSFLFGCLTGTRVLTRIKALAKLKLDQLLKLIRRTNFPPHNCIQFTRWTRSKPLMKGQKK